MRYILARVREYSKIYSNIDVLENELTYQSRQWQRAVACGSPVKRSVYSFGPRFWFISSVICHIKIQRVRLTSIFILDGTTHAASSRHFEKVRNLPGKKST